MRFSALPTAAAAAALLLASFSAAHASRYRANGDPGAQAGEHLPRNLGGVSSAGVDPALLDGVARAREVLFQLLEDKAAASGSAFVVDEQLTDGDEIWLDASGAVGCAACEVVIAQLKVLAAAGDAFFVAFLSELCKRASVQDADVCEGSVALEGPILARGIRNIAVGSRVSRLFCVYTLGLCDFPEVDPWEVPFPSAEPPVSPQRSPEEVERSRTKRKEPLRIVHYSDIHVDPFYEQGTNANCTKPICCRDYIDSVIDDNFSPAGPHGDHQCDSPRSLEGSMYAAIKELVPDAAFSIFTGDIVDHAVWNTTQAQNTIDIDASYVRMANMGFPVYGTAGNHESSPTNSYPPEGSSDSAQWLYNLLSLAWVRWVGPDGADMARRLGAYSTKHDDLNLRVISLNTNLLYTHNYWLYEEPMQRDPSGQLAWLVRELDAAEKSGERVYIIGHMPMGSSDAFHDGSNYFDQIVRRYSPETIAGLFFGHTHLDEFEVAYRNYSSRSFDGAFATTYVAPSLTPTSGHPSFRVYTVDPETFGVLDITAYRANMDMPDFQAGKGLPKWEKYYSAREVYGPLVSPPLGDQDELTPAFWHNVTEAFERNATVFGEYLARKRRGWMAEDAIAGCDEACKELEICKLRAARAQDNCLTPASLIDLGRRAKSPFNDEGTGTSRRFSIRAEGEECESSVGKSTLGTIAVQRQLLLLAANQGKAAVGETAQDDEVGEL